MVQRPRAVTAALILTVVVGLVSAFVGVLSFVGSPEIAAANDLELLAVQQRCGFAFVVGIGFMAVAGVLDRGRQESRARVTTVLVVGAVGFVWIAAGLASTHLLFGLAGAISCAVIIWLLQRPESQEFFDQEPAEAA